MKEILNNLDGKLNSAVSKFKETLLGIRGGRPTARLVEDIKVDYFGQVLPIKQIASINVLPPREIQISAWDKTVVPTIAKAIEAANLNVGISNEGTMVRITLPQLSQERREELIKLVKKESEESRIQIRSIRDDANKEVKCKEENGDITEDEKFKLKDEVQKKVDKANADVESLLENKIGEIEEQ